MAKLFFHGDDSISKYTSVPLESIATWLKAQDVIALDTETSVTDSILDRELMVISMSDLKGEVNVVIDVAMLRPEVLLALLKGISKKLCIIHSVMFDYSMFKKYGVRLNKTWCTMLAEENLNNGYSRGEGSLSLKAVLLDRFDLDISKAEQLTFAERPYTDNQIAYAAVDTMRLGEVYTQQKQEMRNIDASVRQKGNKGVIKANWWDNEFAKVASDMSDYGLNIDKDKWFAIEDSVKPTYEEELKALNDLILENHKPYLIEEGKYSNEGAFVSNVWTSSSKKLHVLGGIFPGLEKVSKDELKKYLRDFDPDFPEELTDSLNKKLWRTHSYPTTYDSKYALLKLNINRSTTEPELSEEPLNKFLLDNFKEWLVEEEIYRPPNTLSFNWASQKQRLELFQQFDPTIESTGKEVLADYTGSSPVILHYLAWSDVDYRLKMFGKSFYEKGADMDGLFRTRFRLVLKTGRLGSVKPMLLNIPNQQPYRESIIPHKGRVLIDSDWSAQEVVIAATLARETAWLDNIKHGWDQHSRNAALIYGDDWLRAAEDDCEYYALDDKGNPKYQKCSCPKHKEMRNDSKAVTFLFFFGGTKYKLAFNLKITEDRAEYILNKFKAAVPNIVAMMSKFAAYGLSTGNIIEPVFGRVRFFDKWKLARPEEHSGISRQCFNTPIQSSGSALLKIAAVLIDRHLRHSGLSQFISLILPVHDELVADAEPEYVDIAKKLISSKMELAAKLGGFDIEAEAFSGPNWWSVH